MFENPFTRRGVRPSHGVGIVPYGRGGREIARTLRNPSARKLSIRVLASRRQASLLLALAWCLAGVTGCSGRNSFLAGGPSNNQLKASLSHVEVENQQLRSQVTQLKTENRSMEDRLVREELSNGDLTARLDNARNLLRDRGIDFEDSRQASRQSRRSGFDTEDHDFNQSSSDSRRTLPAGQRSRKTRKPPFARIPGRIEPAPDDDTDDDVSSTSSRPTWSTGGRRSSGTTTSSRHASGNTGLDDSASSEERLRWTSIGDLNAKGQDPTTRR